MHCVVRQNKLETPKEKDEFNKREVHECDVWTRDPDAMVVPDTQSDIKSWIPHQRDLKPTIFKGWFVVYCESIKRELQTKPMYESRCDERLKSRVEESTRLVSLGINMSQVCDGGGKKLKILLCSNP